MTKQNIIDYVMTTPSNPNKAVLEGMLDSIADAGGGGSASLVTLTLTSSATAVPSKDTVIASVNLPSGGIPLNKIKSIFVITSTTDVGAMLTRHGGSEDTAFGLNALLYNITAAVATNVTATFYVTYEE